ncbi:MAG: helix-turn-helix domain-containing protein [Alphaproteobacteria bacterium]
MKNVTEQTDNYNDFADRLSSEILKNYRSVRAFALENGINPSTMALYATGQSEPTRPVLCIIAKALNVSLDWLATGEGLPEKDSLDEMVKDIKVDADLMAEIVKVVNEYLDSLDRELPPEKLGKIYAYLYNYCHKDEPVRRDNIISLIDIAG